MCYSVLFFKHPIAPKSLSGLFKARKDTKFFDNGKIMLMLPPGMMLKDGTVPGGRVYVGIDFRGEDGFVSQHLLDNP